MSVIGSKRFNHEINQKYMWYLRFDHIGDNKINKLKKYDLFSSLILESYSVYESCFQEKMTKLFFVGHGERIIEFFVLLHTNVCGPFDVPVRDGYFYFIIFTDDSS